MKRIPYIYIILLPYVIYLTLRLILEKVSLNSQGIVLMIIAVVIYCAIAAVSVVSGIIISSFRLSPQEAAVWNLVTKILHLPAHAICFLLHCGMMNPFLMLLSWLPAVVSLPLQAVSATMNTGACINGCKNKKLKTKTAIILALLSYVYIIDIITAVIQVVMCCKKKPRLEG